MKTVLFLITIIFLISASVTAFEWKTFDNAFSNSRLNGGKTMLYFKTSWCHYCKKMEKYTFNDEGVKKAMGFFNGVKIDIEGSKKLNSKEQTGRELGAMFNVRGTPVVWFFDSSGKAITSVPGYIPPDIFSRILKYISSDAYKTMKWEQWISENR